MPRPPDDAPEPQVPRGEGEAGADRADQEHHGSEEHDLEPAPPVGEAPGDECADRTAEKRDGHDEARDEGIEGEVALNRVHRAIDDGRVEPEEEPADRSRQC